MHPFFSWFLWSSWSLSWTLSRVDCLSPLHLVLLGFYLLPSSETYSSVASFCLSCCLYFYISGKLFMFPDLGEGPSAEDILCAPAAHSPLITQAICSRGSPIRAVWVLLLWWGDYVGSLWGCLLSSLIDCQALPCGGCWPLFVGTGSWVGSLQNPRCPWGYCWLTGGQSQSSEDSRAVACHWWGKPGPGVSARLLAGIAVSWNLVAGP